MLVSQNHVRTMREAQQSHEEIPKLQTRCVPLKSQMEHVGITKEAQNEKKKRISWEVAGL